MSRLWQVCCCIAVIFTARLAVAQETATVHGGFIFAGTNHFASFPQTGSPIDLFRQLLAMTPDERENYLTNRPPHVRERILEKVQEYEALDPDERELRLRATELQWYLIPLMRESPANRAERLAAIPQNLRELVEDRLEQWEILPPPLQQEFLDDERAVHYFTQINSTNRLVWHDSNAARWNALSEDERQKIIARVNQFFDLTPAEKQETLNTLSDAERQQMEKTLQSFEKLPPEQRIECVRAFVKFAGMSAVEKQEFLKNAARWSQMSPADRQTWRDLVTHVPEWPPLPTGFFPSPPAATMATNHS
jgi:predicted Fe-S protein YdhL (DUF1289 family)